MNEINYKKRVALLLSGHRRSIASTLDNLKLLKRQLNCDIFLHTWSTMESEEVSWRESNYKYKEYEKENILAELSPVDFSIEEQDNEKICNYFNITNNVNEKYFGLFAMTYGMTRSFELLKHYSIKNNHFVAIQYARILSIH